MLSYLYAYHFIMDRKLQWKYLFICLKMFENARFSICNFREKTGNVSRKHTKSALRDFFKADNWNVNKNVFFRLRKRLHFLKWAWESSSICFLKTFPSSFLFELSFCKFQHTFTACVLFFLWKNFDHRYFLYSFRSEKGYPYMMII